MVDINGKDKALVLIALWNHSKEQGISFLGNPTGEPLTLDEAREYVENPNHLYFDYLKGRVMKVDLSGDSFNPRLYDRDNGEGAAQRAVDSM